MMKKSTLFLLMMLFIPMYHYAQICSANPGGDQAICVGEELTLLGEDSPLYLEPLDATWSLFAANPSVSVNFDNANALVTGVSPSNGGTFDAGTYEFELCVICVDHVEACQNVVVIVGEIINPPTIDPHEQEICGSNITLTGSQPDPGVTTSWFISPQFDGSITENGNDLILNHNGFGDCGYTITYIQSIGDCVRTTETKVNFTREYNSVTATVVNPDSCPSCTDRIRVCGTSVGCGGSPEWTLVSVPNGVNPNSVDINNPGSRCSWIDLPANGNYTFGYTIDNGVCQTASTTVSCEIDVQPGFGLSGDEFYTSCQDVWDEKILSLSENFMSGATYSWSVVYSSIANHGITFSDPTSNATDVIFNNVPMTIGPDGWIFRILVTMQYQNCTDSKQYYYYVNPGLEVNTDDIMLLCGGDPYFLPNSNISYAGGGGTTRITVLESPTAAVPVGQTTFASETLNLTEEGTYCFEVNLSRTGTDPITGIQVTCTDTDEFCVIVADVPTIDCGSPIVTCLLTTVLNGNTPTDSQGDPINVPVRWEQVGPPTVNILNADTEDPTITGMMYGETYTFRYIISDDPDCEIICENTVTVLPEEECASCDITVEVSECDEGCYKISLSGADTYMWQPSSGVDDSDPSNPIICDIEENTIYQVFGFVDGEICGSAVIELDKCVGPPPLLCDFTLVERCPTCGCGAPYGGGMVLNSEGKFFHPENYGITIEWTIDGVDIGGTNSNPVYREWTGNNFVLCATVSFPFPDGSLCDTTMCIEVSCHGNCPTVNFATCNDEPFSGYEQCENYMPEWACEFGYFNGWVWVVDAAGNPIDYHIDWYDDNWTDQNPTFVNSWQSGTCGEIPVGIGGSWTNCDELVYFNPDCCTGESPEITCNKYGERDYTINYTPVCGATSYNIEVTCINWWYTETYTVYPGDENEGTFTFELWDGCDDYIISMTATCGEGQVSEPSNCIFLDVSSGGCYELTEPCWDFWGGGERSNEAGSKPRITEGDLIYPNPSRDGQFVLQLDPDYYKAAGALTITIYNISGKLVETMTQEPGVYKSNFNTNLPDGMYLLSIYSKEGMLMNSERLVIGNASNSKP